MPLEFDITDNKSSTSRVALIAILLCCGPVRGATGADNASLRNAWLKAPNSQGAHWNREPLLDRLVAKIDLNGYARAKVLSLFGQPGYSEERYPGRGRADEYRLSAANGKDLRIDCDADNKVSSYFVDAIGCKCPLCDSAAPEIPLSVFKNSKLMQASTSPGSFTMAGFESTLGSQGEIVLARNLAGARVWLNYAETWRLGGEPNQFLIASGHTPSTDVIGNRTVDSWAVVSFAPECLAS